MGALTESMFQTLGNFRQSIVDALKTDLNATTTPETATSGALSTTNAVSEISVTGPVAFTLAAPTSVGQRKTIRCVAAATSPAGTLTVSSPDTTTGYVCQSVFVFDTPGQELILEATSGLLWRCIAKKRAGGAADNVVVGTTVLTGYSMWQDYCLSVDGTKSSTGTKALPNGSAIGERCVITNTTATNTPIGSIDGVFKGALAAAYTHLGTIGVVASTTVTGDMAILEWDGQSWTVLYQTGCTLS